MAFSISPSLIARDSNKTHDTFYAILKILLYILEVSISGALLFSILWAATAALLYDYQKKIFRRPGDGYEIPYGALCTLGHGLLSSITHLAGGFPFWISTLISTGVILFTFLAIAGPIIAISAGWRAVKRRYGQYFVEQDVELASQTQHENYEPVSHADDGDQDDEISENGRRDLQEHDNGRSTGEQTGNAESSRKSSLNLI